AAPAPCAAGPVPAEPTPACPPIPPPSTKAAAPMTRPSFFMASEAGALTERRQEERPVRAVPEGRYGSPMGARRGSTTGQDLGRGPLASRGEASPRLRRRRGSLR